MDGYAILVPIYMAVVVGFAVWMDQRRSEVLLLGMWVLLGLAVLFEVARAVWHRLL